MKPSRDEVYEAACDGNIPLLRELVSRGADLNEIQNGDTFLEDVISSMEIDEKPYKYDVVKALLELGADPKILGEESASPMIPAMLAMDTEMLRLLLVAGADPIAAQGFDDKELLYDWAEFDYRYHTFDSLRLPEEPTEEDKRDEDSWLKFLDRTAVKHGRRRPDHLFLLRQYGARTAQEMRLPGSGS